MLSGYPMHETVVGFSTSTTQYLLRTILKTSNINISRNKVYLKNFVADPDSTDDTELTF
jgi:hypothetical protein